jgi:hypothetical protein
VAPRVYSMSKAWRDAADASTFVTPLVCLATLALVLPGSGRWRGFLAVYLVFGAVVGVAALAGSGVVAHVLNDVAIAAALCAGQAVASARGLSMLGLPGVRPWLIGAFALGVFAAGPDATMAKDLLQAPAWMAARRAREAETRRIVAAIAAAPGPALCETSLYCYWAGKGDALDIFNFTQAVARGHVDPARLVAEIDHGQFATIALQDPQGDSVATRALAARPRGEWIEALRTPRQTVFVRAAAP